MFLVITSQSNFYFVQIILQFLSAIQYYICCSLVCCISLHSNGIVDSAPSNNYGHLRILHNLLGEVLDTCVYAKDIVFLWRVVTIIETSGLLTYQNNTIIAFLARVSVVQCLF